MKKIVLLVIFSLLSQIVCSQNYKSIDASVERYPEYKSLLEVSTRVNIDFLSDEDKVRAFYIWITLNIDYNLIKLQKNINDRKALCSGFSLMIKELCNLSNIESHVVLGLTKINADEISSNRNIKDHA